MKTENMTTSEKICLICDDEIDTINNKVLQCEECKQKFHLECSLYSEESFKKFNKCDICKTTDKIDVDIQLTEDELERFRKRDICCYFCHSKEGILYRLKEKDKKYKIRDWTHLKCIRWFEHVLNENLSSNFIYLVFNPINMRVFDSECFLCNRTKKGDFFIRCKKKECDSKYYHRKCILTNPELKRNVQSFNPSKGLYLYTFHCNEHINKKSEIMKHSVYGRNVNDEDSFNSKTIKVFNKSCIPNNCEIRGVGLDGLKVKFELGTNSSNSKDITINEDKEKINFSSHVSSINDKFDSFFDTNENKNEMIPSIVCNFKNKEYSTNKLHNKISSHKEFKMSNIKESQSKHKFNWNISSEKIGNNILNANENGPMKKDLTKNFSFTENVEKHNLLFRNSIENKIPNENEFNRINQIPCNLLRKKTTSEQNNILLNNNEKMNYVNKEKTFRLGNLDNDHKLICDLNYGKIINDKKIAKAKVEKPKYINNIIEDENHYNFSYCVLQPTEKCEICTEPISLNIKTLANQKKEFFKCKNCNEILHYKCAKDLKYIYGECLCLKCRYYEINSSSIPLGFKIKCLVCKRSNGVMINLKDKIWIHFICFISLKKSKREIIEEYDHISNSYNEHKHTKFLQAQDCKICRRYSSFIVNCNTCNMSFHAYCGFIFNSFYIKENKVNRINFNDDSKNLMPNSNKIDYDELLNFYNFEIICSRKHKIFKINREQIVNYYEKNIFETKKSNDETIKNFNSNGIEISDQNSHQSNKTGQIIQNFHNSNDSSFKHLTNFDKNIKMNFYEQDKGSSIFSNTIDKKNSYEDQNQGRENKANIKYSELNISRLISSTSNHKKKMKFSKNKLLDRDIIKISNEDKNKMNLNLVDCLKDNKLQNKKLKNERKLKKLKKRRLKEDTSTALDYNVLNNSDNFSLDNYLKNNNSKNSKPISKENRKITVNLEEIVKFNDNSKGIEKNIQSINITNVKENFFINSLFDNNNNNINEKHFKESSLEDENEKNHYISWDFVKEYFQKFDFKTIKSIANKSYIEKCSNEDHLEEYVATSKQNINSQLQAENKNLINHHENHFLQSPMVGNNISLIINEFDEYTSINRRYLTTKKRLRYCKIKKNNERIFLIYEVSNFLNLMKNTKIKEFMTNNNYQPFSRELDLNENVASKWENIFNHYSMKNKNLFDKNNNFFFCSNNRVDNNIIEEINDYILKLDHEEINEDNPKKEEKVRDTFEQLISKKINNKSEINFELEELKINSNNNIDRKSTEEIMKNNNLIKFNLIDDEVTDKENFLFEDKIENTKFLNSNKTMCSSNSNFIKSEHKIQNNENVIYNKEKNTLIINKLVLKPKDGKFTYNDHRIKKKILNSIKLREAFVLDRDDIRSLKIRKRAIEEINNRFREENKKLREDGILNNINKYDTQTYLSNETIFSFDYLSDIDRMILIYSQMLKITTRQNYRAFKKLIKKKNMTDIINSKLEKLNNSLKLSKYPKIELILDQENKNHNLDSYFICNDSSNKVSEVEKLFSLMFTYEKTSEDVVIDFNSLNLKNYISKIKNIYLEKEELTNLEKNFASKSGIECLKQNERMFQTNPGMIEIMNYDIFDKKDFDILNHTFIREYYSNYRFNQIKRRVKLGFKDKRFEIIIKSRFTNEDLKAMDIGYNPDNNLNYNLKENQNDSFFKNIMDKLSKSDSDCCICMYSELDDTSTIVFCDCCNVGIHLECYGIKDVEEIYLCDICVYILKNQHMNFLPLSNTNLVNSEDDNLSVNKDISIKFEESFQKNQNYTEKQKGSSKLNKFKEENIKMDIDYQRHDNNSDLKKNNSNNFEINISNSNDQDSFINLEDQESDKINKNKIDCKHNDLHYDKLIKNKIVIKEEDKMDICTKDSASFEKNYQNIRENFISTNEKSEYIIAGDNNDIILRMDSSPDPSKDTIANILNAKIQLEIGEENTLPSKIKVDSKLGSYIQNFEIHNDSKNFQNIESRKINSYKNKKNKIPNKKYKKKFLGINLTNSILNEECSLLKIRCKICGCNRGPMKLLDDDDKHEWFHIICVIFSLKYEIYDYRKISIRKINIFEDSHVALFMKNYKFYFDNLYQKQNIDFTVENTLSGLYKNLHSDRAKVSCASCHSDIGEIFPCLECLENCIYGIENNRQEKAKSSDIPHYHVLCAYLNGFKMEVLENDITESFENYYNSLLPKRDYEKYKIKKTRLLAKIHCFDHSQDSSRNIEIQREFRKITYHQETFNFSQFKNKFPQTAKNNLINNGEIRTSNLTSENNEQNQKKLKKPYKNSESIAVKFFDNSTEAETNNNLRNIPNTKLSSKLEKNSLTIPLKKAQKINKKNVKKNILYIPNNKYNQKSSHENLVDEEIYSKLKSQLISYHKFINICGYKIPLEKKNFLHSAENNSNKIKFLDFYLKQNNRIDNYKNFCKNEIYSNFCCICFEEFNAEDTKISCRRCYISYHNSCYNEDNLISTTNGFCDYCFNLSRSKNNTFDDPECLLCSQVGGAVKRMSINISHIKLKYKDFNLFWGHSICGNYLDLKSSKKRFDGLFSLMDFLNIYECDICNSKRGYVIKCAIKDCNSKFHLICVKLRNINNRNHQEKENIYNDVNNLQNFKDKPILCQLHSFLEVYTIHTEKKRILANNISEIANIKTLERLLSGEVVKNKLRKISNENNDSQSVIIEIDSLNSEQKAREPDNSKILIKMLEIKEHLHENKSYDINSNNKKKFSIIQPSDYNIIFLKLLELPYMLLELLYEKAKEQIQ